MNTPTPEREVIEKELGSASGIEAQSQSQSQSQSQISTSKQAVKGSGSKRDGEVHGLVGRGQIR